jgi:hypothetical protein
VNAPERRQSGGRRADDELTPEILLGYERWAGQLWRHRGKLAVLIGATTSLAGCVVGYMGRAHDIDEVKVRLARVEVVQDEQVRLEGVKMQMLCSLVRRIDPLGVPADCTAPQVRR